jgi:hypothetical protein
MAPKQYNMAMSMLPLGVYYLSDYIPNDAQTLWIIRGVFAVIFAASLYTLIVTRRSIVRRNETEETVRIETKVKKGKGKKATTEVTEEVLSVLDYDLREWQSLVRTTVGGQVLVCLIHALFPSTVTMLLISGFMAPFTLADNALVKIHIFKMRAEGSCARPFGGDAGMFDALGEQYKELKKELSGETDAKRRAQEREDLQRKAAIAAASVNAHAKHS